MCSVLCFVLPPKQSGVLECHHIHILKNENYELCFLVGSFVDQITTKKKGTVVWPLVAMSDCFGRFVAMLFGEFLDQITNYDRKKRYSRLARLHHLQLT